MYWLPRDTERRASKVLDPIGQLLLVHIPKAGGSSFYEGMNRYLGRCGVAKQCENYAFSQYGSTGQTNMLMRVVSKF